MRFRSTMIPFSSEFGEFEVKLNIPLVHEEKVIEQIWII